MSAASWAFAEGTIAVVNPDSYAAMSDGNTPRTDRKAPSSPSSPKNIMLVSRSSGKATLALTIAIQIAKSKLEPLLGSHAGESETVTLRCGQTSPQFTSAARIRSRDSESAVSGKPKSVYEGIPSAISTSTVTTFPEIPCSDTANVEARLIKGLLDIQSCELNLRQ